MSSLRYNLVAVGDTKNVTVVVDGEMYVADNNHPSFNQILDKVLAGDESVVELFDVARTANEKFQALGERVSIRGGTVYFDGDAQDTALAQQIARFVHEGQDFQPLVRFMENLATNPLEHSRQQLFEWLRKRDFTITSDGMIVAYKGISPDGLSVHSGTAVVDGVEVTGRIPNKAGSVIEMPRTKVAHDPNSSCSTGLHVGEWRYASTFASVVLEVLVNPRDVVSVPHDSNSEKVRVCRYTVLAEVTAPRTSALLADELALDDTQDEFEELSFEPNSSAIEYVYWSNDDNVLTIDFTNGNGVEYQDVPRDVVVEFKNARSAGRFYNDYIKGVYRI